MARKASRHSAAGKGSRPICTTARAKSFWKAGKRRLMGDTKRQATSGEVLSLRKENGQLKELVADLSLDKQMLKDVLPKKP